MEHCIKIKFIYYVHQTLINTYNHRNSVTLCVISNLYLSFREYISQLWSNVRRQNLVPTLSGTNKQNNYLVILSHLSDLVMYKLIWSRGVHISSLEHNRKLKFSM